MKLKATKSFASPLVSPSSGDIVELKAADAKELIECGYLVKANDKAETKKDDSDENV